MKYNNNKKKRKQKMLKDNYVMFMCSLKARSKHCNYVVLQLQKLNPLQETTNIWHSYVTSNT
jgi:hypothetical protein